MQIDPGEREFGRQVRGLIDLHGRLTLDGNPNVTSLSQGSQRRNTIGRIGRVAQLQPTTLAGNGRERNAVDLMDPLPQPEEGQPPVGGQGKTEFLPEKDLCPLKFNVSRVTSTRGSVF